MVVVVVCVVVVGVVVLVVVMVCVVVLVVEVVVFSLPSSQPSTHSKPKLWQYCSQSAYLGGRSWTDSEPPLVPLSTKTSHSPHTRSLCLLGHSAGSQVSALTNSLGSIILCQSTTISLTTPCLRNPVGKFTITWFNVNPVICPSTFRSCSQTVACHVT